MYAKFWYWYVAFPMIVSVYSPFVCRWEYLITQISILFLTSYLFVVFIIILMFDLVLFSIIVRVWEREWVSVYVSLVCVCVCVFVIFVLQ